MAEELTPLSDREMEIVRLLATGATNQQIARELVISINTVKVHLRNIYAKLGVASRTEATMVAVRQGWVPVSQARALAAEEEAGEGAQMALPPLALPGVGRWPRVSVAKRLALLAATLLAVLALFLPQLLSRGARGEGNEAAGGVLSTPVAGAVDSRWRARAQMPTPRADLAVVAYEGLIYAIGGVSDEGVTATVEVYDPQADAWSTGRSKPTPVGFVSAAVVDGKVYVPGGIGADFQPQAVMEVYDPTEDTWATGAPMPEPLGAYGLAAFAGQLYLFGGQGRQGYVASVYRYDVQADRWEKLHPLDQARGLLAAAVLGDRIYVVGGYDGVTEFNTCDAYDPAADTWSPQAPMAVGRGGLDVAVFREYLYAIGGGISGPLAFNERYDPRTGVWDPIETPVTGQWRGVGADTISPYIYTIGGWNKGYLSVNEAYRALFQVYVP